MTGGPVRKLGLGGLSAMVFSMMVGSGIFNIPQNIASGSGLAASMVAWGITAAAMLSLVYTFRQLSLKCPELNAGIYEYARAGFGRYSGFLMAWGYWLCVCFANVAYAVMLNDAFGSFFPSLLHHDWKMVLFGLAFIWGMYCLVSGGLKTARQLNNIMTVLKIVPIVLIIVLLSIWFRLPVAGESWPGFSGFDDLTTQVRDTMLVTLWCFIGIEGAVMMSARARKPRDVSRAGVIGFGTAWILYALVSVLSFGILGRMQLSNLEDPSVAYLLRECCGPWAYWTVIVTVILSVAGSWVSWTMVCAQVPMEAANTGIFPKRFKKLNSHDMPAFGLRVSSVAMSVFLVIVAMSDDVYMAALQITGMMVLPCYLFSALYLIKLGIANAHGLRKSLPVAIICAISCVWMLYSAGPALMATSVFYLAGTGFYITAGKEKNRYYGIMLSRASSWKHYFTAGELTVCILLALLSAASVAAYATGLIKI